MTTGTSYNLMTGKMREQVFEAVKAKDEEIDDIENPEDVAVENSTETTFSELYESQMPKYFQYRSVFPSIKGIWTMLFDQDHYEEMSTFELQAAICAALNSKHHLVLCIGVDAYNSVTGVEMSAVDRVVFRMALTRSVASDFQPPLVKLAPKQLTAITPMKRDVSELLPSIDVLFLPVIGAPKGTEDVEGLTNRFLIVVRVKEVTEKLYQLSSGRVYIEEEGRVVEMNCINDAFKKLVVKSSDSNGSFLMQNPEPFVKNSPIPLEKCDEDLVTLTENAPVTSPVVPQSSPSLIARLVEHIELEHIGWLLFASAMTFGIYHNAIKPLVK